MRFVLDFNFRDFKNSDCFHILETVYNAVLTWL
uniref:Uncharacterized protein n=1 Tax=Anguilla anguilla TaxID=7936 RepID=A0A0E9QP73_ANGAN